MISICPDRPSLPPWSGGRLTVIEREAGLVLIKTNVTPVLNTMNYYVVTITDWVTFGQTPTSNPEHFMNGLVTNQKHVHV